MKKTIIAGIAAVGLAVAVMVPMVASAAANWTCASASDACVAACPAGAPGTFVDENNNGVCDRAEAASSDRPADSGFVDEDGNGVCDRAVEGGTGQANGVGCAGFSGQCQGAAGEGCPLLDNQQSSDDAAPAYGRHYAGHHGGHGCRR